MNLHAQKPAAPEQPPPQWQAPNENRTVDAASALRELVNAQDAHTNVQDRSLQTDSRRRSAASTASVRRLANAWETARTIARASEPEDGAANSPTYPDAVTRAFEIADEAMFRWLHSYGALSHGDPSRIGLTGAGIPGEVTCLAEAGAELREAIKWLQPRGYVELAKDDHGEFIRVLHEPETMYDEQAQAEPPAQRGHE